MTTYTKFLTSPDFSNAESHSVVIDSDTVIDTCKAVEESSVVSFYRAKLKISTACFKCGDIVDRIDFSRTRRRAELFMMSIDEEVPVETLFIGGL